MHQDLEALESTTFAGKRFTRKQRMISFGHSQQGKKSSPSNKSAPAKASMKTKPLSSDDPFIQLWQKIIALVIEVANEFDQTWQQRRRAIDTLLLVLFIFRLVFSKNKQGYATTIIELWDQCRIMNVPLPQHKPVAPSLFVMPEPS
jgi:hypothetical protein